MGGRRQSNPAPAAHAAACDDAACDDATAGDAGEQAACADGWSRRPADDDPAARSDHHSSGADDAEPQAIADRWTGREQQ